MGSLGLLGERVRARLPSRQPCRVVALLRCVFDDAPPERLDQGCPVSGVVSWRRHHYYHRVILKVDHSRNNDAVAAGRDAALAGVVVGRARVVVAAAGAAAVDAHAVALAGDAVALAGAGAVVGAGRGVARQAGVGAAGLVGRVRHVGAAAGHGRRADDAVVGRHVRAVLGVEVVAVVDNGRVLLVALLDAGGREALRELVQIVVDVGSQDVARGMRRLGLGALDLGHGQGAALGDLVLGAALLGGGGGRVGGRVGGLAGGRLGGGRLVR